MIYVIQGMHVYHQLLLWILGVQPCAIASSFFFLFLGELHWVVDKPLNYLLSAHCLQENWTPLILKV